MLVVSENWLIMKVRLVISTKRGKCLFVSLNKNLVTHGEVIRNWGLKNLFHFTNPHNAPVLEKRKFLMIPSAIHLFAKIMVFMFQAESLYSLTLFIFRRPISALGTQLPTPGRQRHLDVHVGAYGLPFLREKEWPKSSYGFPKHLGFLVLFIPYKASVFVTSENIVSIFISNDFWNSIILQGHTLWPRTEMCDKCRRFL